MSSASKGGAVGDGELGASGGGGTAVGIGEKVGLAGKEQGALGHGGGLRKGRCHNPAHRGLGSGLGARAAWPANKASDVHATSQILPVNP